MKKFNTKFISLLLVFSFAASMLVTNAMAEDTGFAVSATEKTRIEGEAATEISGGGYGRTINEGEKALTYASVKKEDGVEYYAKYVVNTEFAGNYSINAVASIRSQTYTTDWTIYANSTDNAVTSYVQGADVTTTWYNGNIKQFSLGTIYLNKGVNEIYWKLNASDAPNGIFQAALDYFELTPPSTFAVSSTGTTRIQGEDATAKIGGGYGRTINEGEKALTYSPVAVTAGAEYYAEYIVNTEFAGYYSINAVASIRSQTYTTDWTIYANTVDNAVTSYVQGADVATTWYNGNIKQFSCGTIYLNKGINTIYWKLNASDAPNGILQAALDYFELTAPKLIQVSTTAATRIEGEDATAKMGGAYGRTINEGQKALTYSPIAPVAGTEYYAEYLVNVDLAGYYSLNAVASERSQTYTTDWTIYANSTDNAAPEYVKGADVATTWFQNVFKEYSCGKIYLNKGINTIYWKVNVQDAASNQLQAAIDYMELTPVVISVPSTGTTRIEGEDYTGAMVNPNVRTMNNPDDGQKAVNYVSFKPEDYSDEEFITTYYLNVEEEGYYDLTVVGSQRGQDFTSDWKIYADTEDNAAPEYVKVADVTTTKFLQNVFKQYDCGKIYLNKGINTLYWKVDRNDAPSGVLQAALDYIEVTRYVPVVVEIGNETVIEAETASKGVISAIGASGEMVVGATSGKIVNTISLNVADSGEYMVEACGTEAQVSVSFDDGNIVTLGDEGTIKTADGSYFAEGMYPYNTYVLSSAVSLLQGEHTVTVTVDGYADGAAVDYIKLTKMLEPSGISVNNIGTLNVGDTANITLNGIDVSDMYMVTYSSNNEAVAVVDGNGRITATGGGETVIDVAIKKYVISEEIKTSLTVSVIEPEIVTVSNVVLSSGQFTAKITKSRQLNAPAKAFIAVYDNENQRLIESVTVVDVEADAGVKDISVPMTAATGNVLGMFVWYSHDIEPLCDPIFITAK